jgi:hypothetical protein
MTRTPDIGGSERLHQVNRKESSLLHQSICRGWCGRVIPQRAVPLTPNYPPPRGKRGGPNAPRSALASRIGSGEGGSGYRSRSPDA